MLKQYVINIFNFVHGRSEEEVRLWKLSSKGNDGFLAFMNYYRAQLERGVSFLA